MDYCTNCGSAMEPSQNFLAFVDNQNNALNNSI